MKTPQTIIVSLWKLNEPTTLSVPGRMVVSIGPELYVAVMKRLVPYWGPEAIEGHVALELPLELNNPIAQRVWRMSASGWRGGPDGRHWSTVGIR